MCAQISDLFPITNKDEKNTSSNFRDSLNIYFYHWPLFVLCLIITLSVAVYFIKHKASYYTVKATVIIKDDKKAPAAQEKLSELDLTAQSKLAENELEVLKSRKLTTQVVNDLGLWINYKQGSKSSGDDLYASTPVAFKVVDSIGAFDKRSFRVKIKDNKSFYLIKSDGSLKEFRFYDVLANSFCTWKLIPTKNLQKYIGTTLTITLNNVERVSEVYQKAIEAEIPNKTVPVINFTIKDEVEQRGKDVLNHLIVSYNSGVVAQKNQLTKSTLDFLDARIATLASELNNSEKQVEGYRSSKGLTDISSQSKVYLENAQLNDNKLNDVNVQLNVVEGIEQYLNSSQSIQSASASLGPNYPALNSLIEKLSVVQSQKDKLLATTPESNPVFDPLNQQIKSLKVEIRDNIRNIKRSLMASKSQLQSYGSQFESTIKDIPVQERELVDKTRKKTTKENLYVYLLQKREEISFNYASTLPDASIVDYAYSGSAKSSAALLIFGVAFIFGLLIPFGIITVRNILSNRITEGREIENFTGKRIFGELSNAAAVGDKIKLDGDNVQLGEEFRGVRTNLHLLKGSTATNWVSVITSSISNEGKSFFSSKLASVVSASGKKTVLLEMDLRRPKISQLFDLPKNKLGITDYLNGTANLSDIIQPCPDHQNMDIISSGTTTADPSELLEQKTLSTLITELRARYQHIIIDTPPVNLVTDARIVASFADCIFYIIRQGVTFKSLLPFIKSLGAERNFQTMNLIFNGVEKGRYGYGHNYGNEYYQEMNQGNHNRNKFRFADLLKRF
ncbi:polysaccharide biosynthesis tyrosine autokinase [Mucilaginibacter conchicola]|uniref:Polysaccharide biosynthesis tyrosine autokinase n=1 Tax=Mucilaginibacter conchicola TaxID=2303333 RepID=A0A372NXJ8_9SPHI|nr:polysaccharide biosynthesis tyrosine autokinase [Mucilaginibacter conchicola]RFZ94843.1 polysaccharide biosynthesis tyrosine autokinase [Mucilaginibacter conchicola]